MDIKSDANKSMRKTKKNDVLQMAAIFTIIIVSIEILPIKLINFSTAS